MVSSPIILLNSQYSCYDVALNYRDIIGTSIWALGFAIESISDVQKI